MQRIAPAFTNLLPACFILLLMATGTQAADCKAIQDPAARLACFDAAPVASKPAIAKQTPKPAAVAVDGPGRECILKAGEALPKIPGLVIKNSRAAARPAPANWTSPIPPIMVDLGIVAAGQAETYTYLCITGPSGTAVQRVGS